MTFFSNIVKISRKRAIIRNNGALFRKENIKSWTFSLKSVMKLFSQNSGDITGISLFFKKIFNRDQYTLEFFWVFINLFAYLLYYDNIFL